MKIADRPVGGGAAPLVIAEMSGNHNQSLERALEIVDAAAAAGAHALKIQTYTADTMTLDVSEGEFSIRDKNSLWNGKTLYQLYQEAHTPWEWHAPIFERARRRVAELAASGTAVDYAVTLREIQERDRRDAGRDAAPMIPAPDAVLVDSSTQTLEEVVDSLASYVEARRKPAAGDQ